MLTGALEAPVLPRVEQLHEIDGVRAVERGGKDRDEDDDERRRTDCPLRRRHANLRRK